MKKQGIRREKILSMPRKIMTARQEQRYACWYAQNRDRKVWKIGEMGHRAEKELSLSHLIIDC